MEYLSVAEIAKIWNVSERTVRNYCAQGKIPQAFMTGKTWNIPKDTVRPSRINRSIRSASLLEILKDEKERKVSGGIYHKIQIEMTYNSNHIEGSKLSRDQTRYIFETNTIDVDNRSIINVDDIVETANHFKCIDLVIENANYALSEKFIKLLHFTLKNGTSDSRRSWCTVGGYKILPNEVGGKETTPPEEVSSAIKALLSAYRGENKTIEDIIAFHKAFESIHPFQDGNGRIGRLIAFKECLRNNIVPFFIDDELKLFYYRGLAEWNSEKGYLIDTCLAAQDKFKKYLDYFKILY